MTIHSVPSAGASMPLDCLVTPALAFSHPGEGLTNPCLPAPERKAILASWASDAHAVENMPWLRQLENGSIVPLSEVLAALRALDRGMEDEPVRSRPERRAGKRAGILFRRPGRTIATESAR